MNFERIHSQLLINDTSIRLKTVIELRERIEIVHTNELQNFLHHLLPAFQILLNEKIPVSFTETNENRIRCIILEIINRIPNTETLKPYIFDILHLIMNVLKTDNEENCLISIRILFDLHKNYRPALVNEVQCFLDHVRLMYENAAVTLKKSFSNDLKQQESSTSVDHSLNEDINIEREKNSNITMDVNKNKVKQNTDHSFQETTKEMNYSFKNQTKVKNEIKSNFNTKRPISDISISDERDSNIHLGIANDTLSDKLIQPSKKQKKVLSSSLDSFKVLTECPLVVMLQFQLYPPFIESNIQLLVPLMMSTLSLRAPPDAQVNFRTKYGEFIACQVKTLSFISYLLRGFANMMRPFQASIGENVVKLMETCPCDAISTRKELLVATRHILSTDFRKVFYNHLDSLLNEKILMGEGRTSFDQIRPLAFSTLADLIHHIRTLLTLNQIMKVINLFAKNIHDPTLPVSIQTTSVRLLLNLVDFAFNNNDSDPHIGRNILTRILQVLVTKFQALVKYIPMALAVHFSRGNKDNKKKLQSLSSHETETFILLRNSSFVPKDVEMKDTIGDNNENNECHKDMKNLFDRLEVLPNNILTTNATSSNYYFYYSDEENTVRDILSLLKTMILGLRTVIWCASNYRQEKNTYINTLTEDEKVLLSSFFKNGLRCFIIYYFLNRASDENDDTIINEEKELLDHMAGVFTDIDEAVFRDLFIQHMQFLYECILQDDNIMTIPQHFLANEKISFIFADILLRFLVTQMGELQHGSQKTVHGGFCSGIYVESSSSIPCNGDGMKPDCNISAEEATSPCKATNLLYENLRQISNNEKSDILMRLFKIVFGSVTLFSKNESVLQPHLKKIIVKCLTLVTKTREVSNYFFLLRALFRSISGGKYPYFYNEIQSVLSLLLSSLTRLYIYNTGCHFFKKIIIELCLTLPARLSSLLQYLPMLFNPLVEAILSKGELATLGLHTFEFWLENLNTEFLFPILTSQKHMYSKIIFGLTSHLLPPPYPHGQLAMRLLGKLGGRNRLFLDDQPFNLSYDDSNCINNIDGTAFKFYFPLGLEKETGSNTVIQFDSYIDRVSSLLRIFCSNNDFTTYNQQSDRDTDMVNNTILHQKQEAFQFVVNCVGLICKFESAPLSTSSAGAGARGLDQNEDEAVNILEDEMEKCYNFENSYPDFSAFSSEKKKKEENNLKKLLLSIFYACHDKDLQEKANEILDNIIVYYVLTIKALASQTKPNPEILSKFNDTTSVLIDIMLEDLQEALYGTIKIKYNNTVSLDIFLLNKVMLKAFMDINPSIVNVAINKIKVLVEVIRNLSNEDTDGGPAVIWNLVQSFVSSCYNKMSWRVKLGGVRGIRALLHHCNINNYNWCNANEIFVIKALLFVLYDHPSEAPIIVTEEAEEAIKELLLKTRNKTMVHNDLWNRQLLNVLIKEITNPKVNVRKKAYYIMKSIYNKEEKNKGETYLELLEPYKDIILSNIYNISLRQIPLPNAVGYIDVLTYLLQLKKNNGGGVAMSKRLLLVLQEALVLTYSNEPMVEDCLNYSGPNNLSDISNIFGNSNDGKNGKRSSSTLQSPIRNIKIATNNNQDSGFQMVGGGLLNKGNRLYPFESSLACQLRITMIRLTREFFISYADELKNNGTSSQDNSSSIELRNRLISLLFKSLMEQPSEIAEIAQSALIDIINLSDTINNNALLPKDLLQHCLRPVLLNLADYRKLSVPLLDGLARLLQLLSPCFNITLIEKLIEHLSQWRDPPKIINNYNTIKKSTVTSSNQLNIMNSNNNNEIINISVKILFLFHLLPPFFTQALISQIITIVIDIEAVLYKYYSSPNGESNKSYTTMFASPYREPLLLFLNKYNKEAVSYFLDKSNLVNKKCSNLFHYLLKQKKASGLRAVFYNKGGVDLLFQATFGKLHSTGSKTPENDKHHSTFKGNMDIIGFQPKSNHSSVSSTSTSLNNESLIDTTTKNNDYNNYFSKDAEYKIDNQILANAQKAYEQTLSNTQAQGLSYQIAVLHAQQAKRNYIMKAQHQLINSSYQMSRDEHQLTEVGNNMESTKINEGLELQYQGLRILKLLLKNNGEWILHEPTILEYLRLLWRSTGRVQRMLLYEDNSIYGNNNLFLHNETKYIAKCLIVYIKYQTKSKHNQKNDHSDICIKILFDLLTVFLYRSSIDYFFLRKFFIKDISYYFQQNKEKNNMTKKKIFYYFLKMIVDKNISNSMKVNAIQFIMLPILSSSFANKDTELLDAPLLRRLMTDIFSNPNIYGNHTDKSLRGNPSCVTTGCDECLRIELLQLATLFITHCSNELLDHRKDLIKFAWNHLKSTDTTSKQWAYVNVCKFIAVYDTPPKIILQVYVALLRTYQSDAKSLVKKALDILLPHLSFRLPQAEYIKAIKWTKKILFEEGHLIPQLFHIWEFLARHPNLFYNFRSQFVPHMISQLTRLALPPNSQLENRKLATNGIQLIIYWEIRRREKQRSTYTNGTTDYEDKTIEEESNKLNEDGQELGKLSDKWQITDMNRPTKKMKISSSKELHNFQRPFNYTTIPSNPNDDDDFELTEQMVEVIINFVLRFALASADNSNNSKDNLSKRCIFLFNTITLLYPMANVRFIYFEKLISVSEAINNTLKHNIPYPAKQSVATLDESETSNKNTALESKRSILQVPAEVTKSVDTIKISPSRLCTNKTDANARKNSNNDNMNNGMARDKMNTQKRTSPLSSVGVLDVVMEILSILSTPPVIQASCLPSNNCDDNKHKRPFVLLHANMIKKLLFPCFLKNEKKIWDKLYIYLNRITKMFPPDHAPEEFIKCNFYDWLRETILDIIQKVLIKDVTSMNMGNKNIGRDISINTTKVKIKKESSNSGIHNKNENKKSSSSHNNINICNENNEFLLRFEKSNCSYLIKLLLSMGGNCRHFTDGFVSVVGKLTQKLAKEHLSANNSQFTNTGKSVLHGAIGGNPLGTHPGELNSLNVCATPTLAAISDWSDRNRKNEAFYYYYNNTTSNNDDDESDSHHYCSHNYDTSKRKRSVKYAQKEVTEIHHRSNKITETLIDCLIFLSESTFTTNEQRRTFSFVLLQIIEKSDDTILLAHIIKIFRKLVTNNVGDNISITNQLKNKNEIMFFLRKMGSFNLLDEKKSFSLFNAYHCLVLDVLTSIYMHDYNNDYDGLDESLLLCGMMSQDYEIRSRYFNLFNHIHGEEIYLKHVLNMFLNIDWKILGPRYWPLLVVHLICQNFTQKTSQTHQNIYESSTIASDINNISNKYNVKEKSNIFVKYDHFIEIYRSNKNHNIMVLSSLMELMHVDVTFGHSLYVHLFPILFNGNSNKDMVNNRLTNVLASNFHRLQLYYPFASSEYSNNNNTNNNINQKNRRLYDAPINIIYTLIDAIIPIANEIKIQPDFLLFLAKTYGCWFHILPLLENKLLNNSIHEESNISKVLNNDESYDASFLESLASIYEKMSMDDWKFGLYYQFTSDVNTKKALVLEAHGHYAAAQKFYYESIQENFNYMEIENNLNKNSFINKINEEKWILCCKQLSQWDSLYDYSCSTKKPLLLLESSLKNGKCNHHYTNHNNPPSIQSLFEDGNVEIRLQKLQLLIYQYNNNTSNNKNLKMKQITRLSNQTSLFLLYHYNQHYANYNLSMIHQKAFHHFHLYLELSECIKIINEISNNNHVTTNHNNTNNLPNLKVYLTNWRERLPLKHENIDIWDDILLSRIRFFTNIILPFFSPWATIHQLALLHDIPFSYNKKIKILRKNHPFSYDHDNYDSYNNKIYDILQILNNINTMDVSDAYEKLRETIILCHNDTNNHDRNLNISNNGLHIINNTNLDYFNVNQKAELFRLKAIFQQNINEYIKLNKDTSTNIDNNNPNQSFSHCLQICENHAKGWLSWGSYCDRLSQMTNTNNNDKTNFSVQAIICYLQAIHHRSKSARQKIARVLWLLSDTTNEHVSAKKYKAFETYGRQLPIWLWIIWIPQLLTALTRTEAPQIRGLLKGLAAKFPQAIYYTMRAYLLEKREECNQLNDENNNYLKTCLIYIEDLMFFLREQNKKLTFELESMLEVIIKKYRPKPHEELYSALHALLIKCYQIDFINHQDSKENLLLKRSLHETLIRIHSKFFLSTNNNTKENKTLREEVFLHMFKGKFENDFCIHKDNTVLVDNSYSILSKLKLWKYFLEKHIKINNNNNNNNNKLLYFSNFSGIIEIPGQYFADKEPISDLHTRLLYFNNNVTVVNSNRYIQRRIHLVGDDNNDYYFLIQFAVPYITRSDERISQIHLLVNRLLKKDNNSSNLQTRKRYLKLKIPIVIPITPRVRLNADYHDMVSMGQIFEYHCMANQMDPDWPILLYCKKMKQIHEKLRNNNQSIDQNNSHDQLMAEKLNIYKEICGLNNNKIILTNYIHSLYPSYNNYYYYRNLFTTNYALINFLLYIFNVINRTPYKYLLSRKNGDFLTYDFRPNYDPNNGLFDLDRHNDIESVPLRLTQNINHFITINGIKGPIVLLLSILGNNLMRNIDNFENELNLFFRDEYISWKNNNHNPNINNNKLNDPENTNNMIHKAVINNVTSVKNNIQSLICKKIFPYDINQNHLKDTNTIFDKNNKIIFDGSALLVHKSMDPMNLAQMPPTWLPWM